MLLHLYKSRHSIMFYPSRSMDASPDSLNLTFENVHLPITRDSVLHGWFIPGHGTQKRKLIIFSHGNAGNISHRTPFIKFWKDEMSNNYDFFIYDYPGFGQSKPDFAPTVETAKKALNTVLNYFLPMYKIENICLYGESIGAAITAVVAAEFLTTQINKRRRLKFDRIVMQSSFSSLSDMGRFILSNHTNDAMSSIVSPLLSLVPDELHVVRALQVLKRINQNVILMHSKEDEVVPWEQYDKMKHLVTKTIELTGSHNETIFSSALARNILS